MHKLAIPHFYSLSRMRANEGDLGNGEDSERITQTNPNSTSIKDKARMARYTS